jgi:hypothetical protein
MTTKELEAKLFKTLSKMGVYMCLEVAMPHHAGINGYGNRERVDLLLLEAHGWNYESGIWRCFEIKVSKSDFHSKAAVTFYGNFNYYAMPRELYEKVKQEIPDGIGVFVADEHYDHCECVRKPKRIELVIPHNKLLFALMQGLSREYRKTKRAEGEKE